MNCWAGSLKVKADQGVSLQQGGRDLLGVFALPAQPLGLTLGLDLVSSWRRERQLFSLGITVLALRG